MSTADRKLIDKCVKQIVDAAVKDADAPVAAITLLVGVVLKDLNRIADVLVGEKS